MSIPAGQKTFYAKHRQAWRKWLDKHHTEEKKVWLLIFRKKSGTSSVYPDEAVQEALCYGWIDSKALKRDEESYYLSFSPRKARSVWSKVNKERIKKLISDGLMMPAGMSAISLAKKNGAWTSLDKVEALTVPPDLEKALLANKDALENFSAFPRSSKKLILTWIDNAKRDETRKKRIEESVRLASKNVRANHPKPKA